jgi:hypothetical protein
VLHLLRGPLERRLGLLQLLPHPSHLKVLKIEYPEK